jgi:hypothetical protein
MNGERALSMLETGATAMLVTLALVAAYVVLKRMARQMRKGVDLATRQSIDEVSMRWKSDGRLHVHIALPQGMSGRVAVSFEPVEQGEQMPVYEGMNASASLELTLDVPSRAKALVIEAPSEKLFRPLPPRS